MACWVNPDGTIQCSDGDLSPATTTGIAAALGQHAKNWQVGTPGQAAQLAKVAQRLAEIGAPTVVLVLEPSELPP